MQEYPLYQLDQPKEPNIVNRKQDGKEHIAHSYVHSETIQYKKNSLNLTYKMDAFKPLI